MEVWERLSKLGFVKVVVGFSGGNDEGGIEEVYGFRAGSDEPVSLELDWNDPLYELLEKPIDDEYGSFAGDFSVCGQVEYDVENRVATMSRSEQVWQDSDSFEVAV